MKFVVNPIGQTISVYRVVTHLGYNSTSVTQTGYNPIRGLPNDIHLDNVYFCCNPRVTKMIQNDIQLDNTVTRIVYLKCIAL